MAQEFSWRVYCASFRRTTATQQLNYLMNKFLGKCSWLFIALSTANHPPPAIKFLSNEQISRFFPFLFPQLRAKAIGVCYCLWMSSAKYLLTHYIFGRNTNEKEMSSKICGMWHKNISRVKNKISVQYTILRTALFRGRDCKNNHLCNYFTHL